jgi:hypothetical protein
LGHVTNVLQMFYFVLQGSSIRSEPISGDRPRAGSQPGKISSGMGKV